MSLMDGLSGWLKQIVAAVLLASLIDLLLPNRTMQRYVRLVAGLFVLLTVATPLLQWMQSDFGSKLTAELDHAARPLLTDEAQLSRIRAEGVKLRRQQTETAAQLAAVRLEEEMKEGIEQLEKRRVREVDVQLVTEPDGRLSIEGAVVTLEAAGGRTGGRRGASEAGKPIAGIEPVAPVTVDIAPVTERTDDAVEADAQPGGSVREPPDPAAQHRITAFITARYGIPADLVTVRESAAN